MMTEQVLTIPEFATALKISRALAYKLVAMGEVKAVNIGARRKVIPVSVVEKMLSVEKKEG